MGIGKEKADGADRQAVVTLHLEYEAAAAGRVGRGDGTVHPSIGIQAPDSERESVVDGLPDIEQ